ncbi:uncharacterized protein si:dkey-86e18.1 isoform X1 [Polyodon spathula]|uniref:uncharacterized protein si:dkey-86e18.1 isoform X1 n=1 Tax=Polyodon spathula TaxID=7913 RepID=UPI001B7E0501|nr:uncharacterized protein si:dkey-86e18.1 isoform X1 [Polyodon spathula]
MARNHEKQLGRLNRVWLQREREEGRLKDVHQNRPKLSSLNSAADVKRWIPSIKNEIEYYLQQSQLPHYPERKIAEFQQHIEDLRREYQGHIRKLRTLEPSNKEHPWKLRGYTRKRQAPVGAQSESQADPGSVKKLCTPVLSMPVHQGRDESDSDEEQESNWKVDPLSSDRSAPVYNCPSVDCEVQDRPLSFNPRKIPLKFTGHAVSGCEAGNHDDTDKLTQILLSGLPNLHNNPSVNPGRTAAAWISGEAGAAEISEAQEPSGATRDLLGLGCYSSSEEEM